MASTYSTSDLATAVLRELSQIDATEDADDHPESRDMIVDAYGQKYSELRALEMVYWPSSAIPAEVFLPVRDLVMNEVVGSFGQAMSPADREAMEQIILKRIRRVTRTAHSKHRTKALYF